MTSALAVGFFKPTYCVPICSRKGIIKQVIHILPLLLSYVTPCFDDSDDDDDYNDDDDDDDDNDDDEKP